MGTMLLPQRAAKTKGGTLCAVLSLALAFQSTRWTLGTAQARPQQSLCESPAGGIRVYSQRGENVFHPCISALCTTNLGAAARKQLTLVDVVPNRTALTWGEANFAPAASLKSVTALWTQLFPSLPSLPCFTPTKCYTASKACLREHFPGPYLIVSSPSSTSSS